MTENNLVPLIINLASRNRHYVVFVGAGLSIDAGVMSGWEILIETLKPLYLEEKKSKKLPNDYFSIIDKWYTNHKTYSKMGYSEILELMYEGDLERKEFLKQFFIDAKPGESHRQLAQMVNNKLIRFIFTTNFDDLIEKSLEDIGINDYDIIYTDDQLEKSASWDKVTTCRIYKLHGDYKTGKIRNTIVELKSLEKLIACDFQYIIDRHGIIQIGYAGRDEGVMGHYLKRSPFSYPFYWQYKEYPVKKKEFKLFHELANKYKNEHGREIHFVQDDSASNFIQRINEGIDRHERYVIVSDDSAEEYEDYIINNEEKKIRAMSIRLSDKFGELYDEYTGKEESNPNYSYRYEIFSEYIGEIEFIFKYVESLLRYDVLSEIKYFMNKVINHITSIDLDYAKEFMQKSSPYYVIMMFGSLILKYDHQSLIDDFFKIEYKKSSGNYGKLMRKISYGIEGWKHIGKEVYGKNYLSPRYQVIEQNILPQNVSVEDFNRFDSYVILYSLIVFENIEWYPGSPMYYSSHYVGDVFNSFFKQKISNKEDAQILSNKLSQLRNNLRYDRGSGLDNLIEKLNMLYS